MLMAVPADVLTGRRGYVPEVALEESGPRVICGQPQILNPAYSVIPRGQTKVQSAASSIMLVP